MLFSNLCSWPGAFVGHSTGPIHVNPDLIMNVLSVSETIKFSGGGMAGSILVVNLTLVFKEFGETTLTPLQQIEAKRIVLATYN